MSTKGLGRKTLSGISWTLMGSIVANATRFATVPILVRLLTPAEFGVVAVALTVVGFAIRFAQLGLGAALIQRKEIDSEHVATTFAWMLSLGTAITIGIWFGAEFIAHLFDMSKATDLIRALSCLFFIRALSSTSRFLLQRDLRFKAIASMNVISYIAGSATSIALAFADYGAWALVIGYLVEASLESALILIMSPPVVRPRFHAGALRDLFGFGSGQTVTSVANYFAQQGDYIVVGRYLGDAMLGIYSRAYELMRFPALIFHSVAGTVLFASFAKIQDEPVRLGDAFRRVLFASAIVLLPASAVLIVLAPEAIELLFGPGWSNVVLPFQIMAVSMLFRTSYKAAGLVARSTGEMMRLAGYEIIYAGLVIGGAMFSMRWGIVGVSITTCLAIVLQFLNLTRVALRKMQIGWRGVIAAHVDGLIMAVLVLILALPVVMTLRSAGHQTFVIAGIGVVSGSVLPIGYALLRLRRGAEDWTWVRDRATQIVTRKKKKRRAATAASGAESSP